jgi:hypothetical protein
MSYANPTILSIPNARGLDAVMQSIQADLASLSWLEKSFGRAWDFKEAKASVPKCYSGKGEYINVLPNDHLTSQSFIRARADEKVIDYQEFSISSFEREISIIFWF